MKLTYWLFIIAAVLTLSGFAVAYVQLADQDALMILHFDQYRGIDYLGSVGDVFSMLGIGLGLVLVNFLLARAFLKRERLYAILLAGLSVLISLLLFIAVLVIISVN